MKEICKQIKGFEGLYSVSNKGNVKHDKTAKGIGTGNYARAERQTGISDGCISDVLHGRRKTAGGFLWQYGK